MQKIASVIVRRRKSVMALMLIITLFCGILSSKVHINEDMTAYLPDDSSMKQGMDIMSAEFPEMEETYSVRVMVQDLTATQKQELLSVLKNLDYVDSVDHDDTEDYNKDNQTLYIVNTVYDYNSDEEKALEDNIAAALDGYTAVMKNNNTALEAIPLYIMAAALGIMMAVLWTMCGSWIEPVLFLLVIGLAVIINSGTNYFLGSVSNITSMISALLQLVLSMDYSIILMNRYQQELALNPNRTEAMSVALTHSFSSIASSSVTTIVGLLALVFMNFKIGMDLGLVLAKGVLISMICVFTVLPGFIIMCTKLIQKTAKKVPHIPMGGLGKFSHKLRLPVTIAFVILFIAAYIMQGSTGIAFTLASEDPIADVFPNSNTIVLVYHNEDDEAVTKMAEELVDSDEQVKAAVSYSTMLGKPYAAEELADSLSTFSDELELDPELLKILYYDYYCQDDTVTMTASEFLHFLADDVLSDDLFADALDSDMTDQIDLMMEFADADKLTEQKTISELADIFDMDADMIEKLLLLYYTDHNGAYTGTMTLPTFARFVANEVANNPDYSDMFDSSTLSLMDTLLTFTNASDMTASRSYKGIASLLGIDADTTKLLFVYYYALQDSYDPGTMTMAQFVDLIQNKVAKDPTFGSYLDTATVAQVAMLGTFTDKEAIQTQKTAAQLSQMLGIEQTMIEQLFKIAFPAEDVTDKTISFAEFTGFLVNDILSNPAYASQFDDTVKAQLTQMNQLVQASAAGTKLSAAQLAKILGMEEALVQQIFNMASNSTGVASMPLPAFMDFLCSNILNNDAFAGYFDDAAKAQLQGMNQLIQTAVAREQLNAAQLAAILGMEEAQADTLLKAMNDNAAESNTVYTATLADFIAYAAQYDESLAQMNSLIQTAVAGEQLNAARLAAILGMEEAQADTWLKEMNGSTEESDEVYTATLAEFVAHASQKDASFSQMNQLIQTAVAGEQLNAAQLAATVSMEEAQADTLLKAMNDSAEESDDVYTATLAEFIGYAAQYNENLSQLNQLIQLAVSGQALDTATMAQVLGVEESMVVQLYAIVPNGNPAITEMSLPELTNILVNQILPNEAYASKFDDATKAKIQQMHGLVTLAASNQALTPAQLAAALGMEEAMVTQLFVIYYTDITDCTMSAVELVDFLLKNMSGSLDEATLGKLKLIQSIMSGVLNNKAYSHKEMAAMFGMDASLMKMLYTFRNSLGDTSDWKLSMQTIVNFLLKNKDQFASVMGSNIDQLGMLQSLINHSVSGTAFTYTSLAELLGMDSTQLRQLYLLYQTEHGDTTGWGISLDTFVTFIQKEILSDESYASQLDADAAELLDTARTLMDAVLSGGSYDAAGLTELFGGLSDELDSNTMELVSMLYGSRKQYDPEWKMSIHQLFDHLSGSILSDPRFEDFIDEEVRTAIADNRSTIDDGIAQMKGENYSRLILSTTYSDESEETFQFVGGLIDRCNAELSGDYHFIGSSVMNYEMANSFDSEMLLISLITVLSIFIVVAVTFKSLLIPLILVLIVQCGVYLTVTTIGIQGYSIYYLALLIVQSILMGATIDYGILYTNYYLESRRTMDVKGALIAAYDGSIHTILTSGLILILVTGAVGNLFTNPTVGQICKTISTGSLCASLLILFMLPAILALMDKIIIRKKKKKNRK